ncbi:MAG: prepilin-type N-terminal cleavage/methylation domain-containing protein, partial [Candidatus Desulforudis sp.]|nr:prepilin-type N-terminal cleavage/methylation domain-containing protein [Desulforudis sp.]
MQRIPGEGGLTLVEVLVAVVILGLVLVAVFNLFTVGMRLGGEPLMRPDIWEIVDYVHDKGAMPVIGTNATLITEEIA